MVKYRLCGFDKLYSKESNWAPIWDYDTREEAKEAMIYRSNRLNGRAIGGFTRYEIFEVEV